MNVLDNNWEAIIDEIELCLHATRRKNETYASTLTDNIFSKMLL